MDYDIVATLGPASNTEALWRAMLDAGATAFRLNTSHLTLKAIDEWLDRLDAFRRSTSVAFSVILDLQGSKWRLGTLPDIHLQTGQRVELALAETAPDGSFLPVPHPDFFRAARYSTLGVSLNDGKVHMEIEWAGDDCMAAVVTQAGGVSSRKGITYPSSAFRHERLGTQDREVLAKTLGLSGVQYALSYVKDAAEMSRYRAEIGSPAHLIAKLERQPAVDQVGAVARFANEVWLCRGDLGAELGVRSMAEAVSAFSGQVAAMPVPVLLAGQVLEHMTEHATPTRSEMCYLHESLTRGFRGVVLSDETAVGRYPVQACHMAGAFRG